ncbi:MAG TPA: HNH endonuclease signature motif containing protein [Kofleriaceae bacterium]
MTPRLREQVFARDHQRCTVPGCRSARNLDVHHIIEQARGGTHELWNLTLLCSGHHAALHAGLLTMQGQAPYGIAFRWTYGPPIPAGLDPEARKVMVARRVNEILERVWAPESIPGDASAERTRCPTWDADTARRGRAMPP